MLHYTGLDSFIILLNFIPVQEPSVPFQNVLCDAYITITDFFLSFFHCSAYDNIIHIKS